MILEIMMIDQFASHFDMAYKTIQHVSALNLKFVRPMKAELWAKKFKDSLFCYIEKWTGDHSFAHQPETCRDTSKWGHLRCLKIYS